MVACINSCRLETHSRVIIQAVSTPPLTLMEVPSTISSFLVSYFHVGFYIFNGVQQSCEPAFVLVTGNLNSCCLLK